MIHPGLEVHHPENQDDEGFFQIIFILDENSWFIILSIILPIILASSYFCGQCLGHGTIQVRDSGSQLPPAGQFFEK